MKTNIVVSGAIVDIATKRMLLAQRSGGTTYPFLWCTTGGFVEEGEFQLDALIREVGEELKVNLFDPNLVQNCIYTHDIRSTRSGKMITVRCYFVPSTAIVGTYTCGDKTIGMGWFDAADLARLPLAPADDANREALIAALG